MKNYILYCVLVLGLLFGSCTDVIELDLPVASPRLVIEASIDWQKETLGNDQEIKLSLSSPFYDNLSRNPATGAFVKIINNKNKSEVIFEDQNNGSYTTSEFIAIMGQSYSLEVVYGGETYIATETMTPVPEITRVFQSTENGFDKNALELNLVFNDPIDETNFYLSKFQRRGDLLPTLFDINDEFTNGNEINIIYEKINNDTTGEKEFVPGDIVDMSLYGISEQYFNYIRLLIQQSGNLGGPFSTIPAEIKGNCINISKPDNYAFGYFRLAEVNNRVYTFK
jgi:hypothetical protein